MAEDHRRIESRSIVGTGMATDPERLEQIENEAARRERAWRDQPPEAFGAILGRAPPRGDLADAVTPDKRRQPVNDTRDDDDVDTSTADATPASTKAPPALPERQSLRAPDPRERLLHARLAATTKTPSLTSTPAADAEPRGAALPAPQRGSR